MIKCLYYDTYTTRTILRRLTNSVVTVSTRIFLLPFRLWNISCRPFDYFRVISCLTNQAMHEKNVVIRANRVVVYSRI